MARKGQGIEILSGWQDAGKRLIFPSGGRANVVRCFS